MIVMRQTFNKQERLCNRQLIDRLYKNGSSMSIFPFRVLWQRTQLNSPSSVQIVISVPKRKFKNAVVRNKIKRRIRDAYRKNKNILSSFLETQEQQLTLMLIYNADEPLDYQMIEDKIILALQRLSNEHEKCSD